MKWWVSEKKGGGSRPPGPPPTGSAPEMNEYINPVERMRLIAWEGGDGEWVIRGGGRGRSIIRGKSR